MRFIILLITAICIGLACYLTYQLVKDFNKRRRAGRPNSLPASSPEVLLANLSKRKTSRSQSDELITDAREAATALLLEMAEASEALSARHLQRLRMLLEDQFGFNSEQAEALIDHAKWACEPTSGEVGLWLKLTTRIVSQVSQREIVDLDGMLVEMSEVTGVPTARQMQLLQTFRNRSGIHA